MKYGFIVIVFGSLLVAGCRDASQPPPSSMSGAKESLPSIVSGSTPSEEEKATLLAAKDKLFKELSGRLMDAMSQVGPSGAIKVCQAEAKAIATKVGKEDNVVIGRSGVRLRNANNTPPAWATKLIADKTDTPVFAKLSNGHPVALLPIKLQSQCLMCHGPSEQIAADIKVELARLYPQDQATGFSEGDLRGWFWVESRN